MVDLATVLTAFTTLFVIIDPIGLTPLFVAMTSGMTPAQRWGVALRACAISIVVLAAFGLFGEAVLGFVGISMPAFRIAGGILLFLTALDMLFERRTKRRQDQAQEQDTGPGGDDPSVFPLATPLIAGPGAIASMILLTGQAGNDYVTIAAIHIVMLAVIGLVLLLFSSAAMIERLLGATGILVVTRLLGMLLAALSVQFVLDGVRAVGVLP